MTSIFPQQHNTTQEILSLFLISHPTTYWLNNSHAISLDSTKKCFVSILVDVRRRRWKLNRLSTARLISQDLDMCMEL